MMSKLVIRQKYSVSCRRFVMVGVLVVIVVIAVFFVMRVFMPIIFMTIWFVVIVLIRIENKSDLYKKASIRRKW